MDSICVYCGKPNAILHFIDLDTDDIYSVLICKDGDCWSKYFYKVYKQGITNE